MPEIETLFEPSRTILGPEPTTQVEKASDPEALISETKPELVFGVEQATNPGTGFTAVMPELTLALPSK
jgi:hypothetical protein